MKGRGPEPIGDPLCARSTFSELPETRCESFEKNRRWGAGGQEPMFPGTLHPPCQRSLAEVPDKIETMSQVGSFKDGFNILACEASASLQSRAKPQCNMVQRSRC